jgi:hypothetical protein
MARPIPSVAPVTSATAGVGMPGKIAWSARTGAGNSSRVVRVVKARVPIGVGRDSPGSFGERGDSIGELPEDDGLIGGEPPLGLTDECETLQGREAVAGTGARRPAAEPEQGEPPRSVRQMCGGLEQGGVERGHVGRENAFGDKAHVAR